tara:strand:+ start:218 stop:439 length:222 start_codon:yes stop_codon:yes gene_type:complete
MDNPIDRGKPLAVAKNKNFFRKKFSKAQSLHFTRKAGFSVWLIKHGNRSKVSFGMPHTSWREPNVGNAKTVLS